MSSPRLSPPLKQREPSRVKRQPCQSCRHRNLQCDGERPTCTNCCSRVLKCEYGEPETRTPPDAMDCLDHGTEGSRELPNHDLPTLSSLQQSRLSSSDCSEHPHEGATRSAQQQWPLTIPHSILIWPVVYNHLLRFGACPVSDLEAILQQRTSWFIKRELCSPQSILPSHERPLTTVVFSDSGHDSSHGPRASQIFAGLTLSQVLEYTEAYFNTFNVIFPVLSRGLFDQIILDNIIREDFVYSHGRDAIALFVFALGLVAIEGTSRSPVSVKDGMPSGIRGGSTHHPPGLQLFNEARRRLGTMAFTYTLEKVQALLLQAVYFGSSSRYVEFWHSVTSASMICQVLVRCRAGDYASVEGDMIKRAFWTCLINEDFFHIDLDLPKTGLCALEDEVPMPHFHEAQNSRVMAGHLPVESHLSSFLALIALRRLITRVHALLQERDNFAHIGGDDRIAVLDEMARQLSLWRDALPAFLQWSDSDGSTTVMSPLQHEARSEAQLPLGYDGPTHHNERSAHPPSLGAPVLGHGLNLDIVTAALRTRYYYARLMIYLPFVFKALHSPQTMTAQDAEKCGLAIHSACHWPLAMSPPSNKKRLVPHLFTWTQNYVGILVILRLTTEDPNLRAVCKGRIRTEKITRSTTLMLDWIYDIRQVDTIASWGWQVLERLFFSHTP